MQKKKRSILLCMLCAVSILLTACSLGRKDIIVTCDDYEIKLGKTKLADLKDAGFTELYNYTGVDELQIDSMSWEYFYATKDDVYYGTMLVANKGSSRIEINNGVIFEISLDYDDPESPLGEVLVNGVNFEGYTREAVKEAMGDAEITLDIDTYLGFESGGCNYTFSFADGSETVTHLDVNDGTEKKININ